MKTKMCQKIKCSSCSKWTWTGCGKHIQSALKNIPDYDLCKCNMPKK